MFIFHFNFAKACIISGPISAVIALAILNLVWILIIIYLIIMIKKLQKR